MTIDLLGPVVVTVDGVEVALRRGRQQGLAALLALGAQRVVGIGRLTEALWPDGSPQHPDNAVQHLVAQLRRALGTRRDLVVTVDHGYRLDLPADATDVGRVRAAVAAADGAAAATARRLLDEAAARWRGPSLGGADDGVLGDEARRLDDLRADVEVAYADAAVRSGAVDGALVDRVATACARHPFHEPLWAWYLTVLAATGRRADALATYEQLRRRLADELGVDPSAGVQEVHLRLLREVDKPPRPAAITLPAHALPVPLTSFVGRDEELATLDEWRAGGARLLTVAGPGGVGKTRLAVEHLRSRDEAIVFARLEQVDRDGDVAAAVAAALGVREVGTAQLLDVVLDGVPDGATVLLDNAEHVRAQAAAVVSAIVARRADVAVLVTTQSPLGVPGERVLRVAPLARGDAVDLATAAAAPAARLVLDRSALVRPELSAPGDADRAAAIAIAGVLDGLPLAIELAAARTVVLTLPQIAASLGDHFGLLDGGAPGRGPRHRRMSDAVGWSLDLLTEPTRALFARCAVFAGRFDVAAAAAVAGIAEADALLGLVELGERSLVQAEPGTPPRFRLLQPMRAHGLTVLDGRGGTGPALDRLLGWTLDLAEAADEGLRSTEQATWLERLDDARGDIDRALAHALAIGDVAAASRIAAALGRYWDWRGRLRDMARWTQAVHDASPTQQPVRRVGSVLAWAGFVAFEQGDTDRALALSARGEQVATDQGDDAGRLDALAIQATFARGVGRFDDAHAAIAQAIAVAQAAGSAWGRAWAINSRGYVHAASGDLDAADADADESSRRFRALGDERAAQWGVALAALVAHHRGDAATACALALQVRASAEACADLRTAALAYELLADLVDDDHEQSRLHDVAADFRRLRGQVRPQVPDVPAT